MADSHEETGNDDESRRKKRKDESGKDSKVATQQRSTGQGKTQTGKLSTGVQGKLGNAGTTKGNSEKKSPCTSPKPGSISEGEIEDGKSDLKVPPLKIVIPQSSTSEQESGQSRNGKNSSQRSQALPYVVPSSNSSDNSEKDNSGGTTSPTESVGKAEDKKDTSGNSGDDQATTSNDAEPSTASTSSSTTTTPAPVELHPRKRKMKPSKDLSATPSDVPEAPAVSEMHPHEQPITNCYQLFLNIRKQIEKRRKSLFPVQPKPPQGFKDYLMNRCTYVLAGNSPTTPNVTYPSTLPPPMKDIFTDQEKERYRLRMQHVIEKEKLVLSVEQEILRVHGKAARALANQSLPFSVCTILRDEEVYNLITPEQEEKDRNARSRYNGRLFLSWLQDVDDKWEKIKENMLLRHHNEAESLHAVQKMDWEWKLKELNLCDAKSTPNIEELHVPMNSMEPSNSNELTNDIFNEGPSSPILSNNKISRQTLINRKKQKGKAKLVDQFSSNIQCQANGAIESRLKTIEELERERKKYYNILCNKFPNIVERKQDIKATYDIPVQVQPKLQCVPTKFSNTLELEKPVNIQTASGKQIQIPENVVKEQKHIFDDIFNQCQTLNPAILKCPVTSKMKLSKIPVLNRNAKLKVKAKTTDQQSRIIKDISVEQFKDSSGLLPIGLRHAFGSASDVTIPTSIKAANSTLYNDQNLNMKSKYSANSMSKLYSNHKFEECSSSTNSLEDSYKNSVSVVDASCSTELLKTSDHITDKNNASNTYDCINDFAEITQNDSVRLSVMDIMNDDWSDTYFGDNVIIEGTTGIPEKAMDDMIKFQHTNNGADNIISIKETESNRTAPMGQVINTNYTKSITDNNIININSKMVENFGSFICNQNQVGTILPGNSNKEAMGCDAEAKISDQHSTLSSKSLIHVNIPTCKINCQENVYSKNLIELHRNRNFIGYSEDSASNLEYKLSQHTLQVKRRIFKSQRKIFDNNLLGFDSKIQQLANEETLVFANNIKEIEKRIQNKELALQKNFKEEDQIKDKKRKKNVGVYNEKTRKDQCFQKDAKIKQDKKKKEKKLQEPGNMIVQIPERTVDQIVGNGKVNTNIMYDPFPLTSEQSTKRNKSHNKRKTAIIDKETILENVNNQVIELNPNQKKFKIEIDCNSKFRINICCNGIPNICESECKKNNAKCNKDVPIANADNIKINCKPENVKAKAVLNNTPVKDPTLKKNLFTSEIIEPANSQLPVLDKNEPNNVDAVAKNLEADKKFDQGKLIKKFMSKAQKLYRDMRKSDVSLTQEKQAESTKETDVCINSPQKINHQVITSNNLCGFKSASGKDIAVSEKAFRNAQKMYRDTEKESGKSFKKDNTIEKSANQIENNVSPKIERNKQRTRILYADLENSNHDEAVNVPAGYQIISGKLVKNRHNTRHKDISPKRNDRHNEKNTLPETADVFWGFQSASGKNIKISHDALEKAKRFLDDNNRPAGDSQTQTMLFSGFHSASGAQIDIPEKQLLEARKMHNQCDNSELCMGDFVKVDETPTATCDTPVNNTTSKRAFELLEDVVETVDSALEKIKRHKPSNARRRLGISRCKQINVSKEKMGMAKKLFSNENFTDTVREFSLTTTLKKSQIGATSTPLKNNTSQFQDVRFCKDIESELTPIKHSVAGKNGDAICVDSSIIIQKRTPGSLDDWHATVLKQINSLKDTLKNLEEKKNNLEKQMSFVYYGDKEHKRQRLGVLYKKKMSNAQRVPLKSLDMNCNNNIEDIISSVTSKNANMIHFNYTSLEYTGSTQDGALVIPNAQNFIGLSEIEVAFRTMVGVEPDLIPDGWIANHYRLIIWKLASYERVFSEQLVGSLTVENIVQQLKYRYDREIDKAERPAIRKILEKDDVPQKRMVLCVSDIIEGPNNVIELELTDGWYCITTLIDAPLVAAVRRKKIKIGTKLLICGAQLLNCDGCHPLQVTDFVKLKINYNCTRRAIWYAKLGYQKFPGPIAIPLSSVHPDGGMISCVKVHIVRVYPLRYMEQIDNKKVWRNGKAEEKYANAFENNRLEKIENIQYSVQAKFERSQWLNTIKNGENIKFIESSGDPESIMEILLPSQRVAILEYRQQIYMQQQQEMAKTVSDEMEKLKLNKRKVTPILKILVLDEMQVSDKPRQFCIWNPKEDDVSILKEGFSLKVYNVVPRLNGDLFSNAKTHFILDKKNESYAKFKRQLLPLSVTLDSHYQPLFNSHYQPLFNEYDTVGLVVQVNSSNTGQSLWITDVTGTMLFIKIRDGPEICSLVDAITIGQVIILSNLIHCKPQKYFGQALANQFTVISTSPRQTHLLEGLNMFKSKLPEDVCVLLKECEQNIGKYNAQVEIKQNNFSMSPMQSNFTSLLSNTLDFSDDSTLIPSRLTATDVAMSLIDTDKFT
ncbi:BRCA2, helical [Popillia japonica]|uniref:BRCA2, helical n=1 Tax=Popillia japonica TaxID=7064 RepID=A0AAW1M6J9_POPJA